MKNKFLTKEILQKYCSVFVLFDEKFCGQKISQYLYCLMIKQYKYCKFSAAELFIKQYKYQ